MHNTHRVHEQLLNYTEATKTDRALELAKMQAIVAIAEQLRIQNLLKAYEMGLAIDPNEIVNTLAGPHETNNQPRTPGR